MKLSSRSRYGTRMMVELARHYDRGPLQIGVIAERQSISPKYLEQIIIPLKKARFIKSVRGPKGGHMLTKPPQDITVGDIVRVLENDTCLALCVEDPQKCDRFEDCLTKDIWKMATKTLYDTLNSITLSQILDNADK